MRQIHEIGSSIAVLMLRSDQWISKSSVSNVLKIDRKHPILFTKTLRSSAKTKGRTGDGELVITRR